MSATTHSSQFSSIHLPLKNQQKFINIFSENWSSVFSTLIFPYIYNFSSAVEPGYLEDKLNFKNSNMNTNRIFLLKIF